MDQNNDDIMKYSNITGISENGDDTPYNDDVEKLAAKIYEENFGGAKKNNKQPIADDVSTDDEGDTNSLFEDSEDELSQEFNPEKEIVDNKMIKEFLESDEEEEDDDDIYEDENYLQKFTESINKEIINDFYPELLMHNNNEIETLTKVVRDTNGIICDPLHRTVPFLTKYEKARILGERAKQIGAGAKPFIKLNENIIDNYLIAVKELEEKQIPFIIKRPLPNGGCEYWKLVDLEFI